MIYLASPYTHPDSAVREARYQAACRQAAEMLRCGIVVFSPIAHSHGIQVLGDLERHEWDWWERFDRPFLEAYSEVWVLTLDGWRKSKGVQAEISIAHKLGKRVMLVEPDTVSVVEYGDSAR